MYYKNGTISSRPKIPVSNPKEEHYRKFGWIPYRRDIPEFDSETQRIEKGEIIETEIEAVQKYNVVDLTPEEIEARIPMEEKLRQEFDQKLDDRVNQIAEAVARGARGQELADKMTKK